MRVVVGITVFQVVLTSGVLGFAVAASRTPPTVVVNVPRPPAPVSAPASAPHEGHKPAVDVDYARATVAGHDADPRAPSAIWSALRAGNARFVANETVERHPDARRHDTAGGQHPGAMILSCADSRVAPELLFDQDVGDLFVVRVAGNVVDPAGVGSFEYAAAHLGSKVLIVLGHEKCGAVTAALSDEAMPTASLRALIGELAPGLSHVGGHGTDAARVHDGVEANVRANAIEVLERSPLLREKVAQGELLVVPAVYDLDSGAVRVLAPVTSTETKPAAEKTEHAEKSAKPEPKLAAHGH